MIAIIIMFCPIANQLFYLLSPWVVSWCKQMWMCHANSQVYSPLCACLFFRNPFLFKLSTLGVGMVQTRKIAYRKFPSPPAELRDWRERDYNKIHRHTMGNAQRKKCACASRHLHTIQTAQGIPHILRRIMPLLLWFFRQAFIMLLYSRIYTICCSILHVKEKKKYVNL